MRRSGQGEKSEVTKSGKLWKAENRQGLARTTMPEPEGKEVGHTSTSERPHNDDDDDFN